MLSCEYHDYIEIVCMFRYPVKLTLVTGDVILGTALDTVRNEANAECVKLTLDDSVFLQEIGSIKSLEVTIDNPHVKQVNFK
ncbi:Rho-binding antiterminator [Reinekea marina]|uniref:Rho-binding antiterminator n=1 Tax=Reinekea marina TaxID=1310421 RepID=A0ABV7WWV0_9GAMM|nr:Rho-binding antiterminator [Reinekea marina]MDN3650151.1 Rho-binding antiterminator [Reinekea marina]